MCLMLAVSRRAPRVPCSKVKVQRSKFKGQGSKVKVQDSDAAARADCFGYGYFPATLAMTRFQGSLFKGQGSKFKIRMLPHKQIASGTVTSQ
jgi:hypothetical protein